MIIDNDSRAIVRVTLRQAMETYSYEPTLSWSHVEALRVAIRECMDNLDKAQRKNDYDAMLGITLKLKSYSEKMHTFVRKLSDGGEA